MQPLTEQGLPFAANAANSLGTLYDAGDRGFQNAAVADKCFRKAAEEGNYDAQFNSGGVMYDIGHSPRVSFASRVIDDAENRCRIPPPKDEGPNMLRYLKQAVAVDPEPSPLANRIQLLETK